MTAKTGDSDMSSQNQIPATVAGIVRDEVLPHDPQVIRAIVNSTGFFHPLGSGHRRGTR